MIPDAVSMGLRGKEAGNLLDWADGVGGGFLNYTITTQDQAVVAYAHTQ